MGLALSLSPTGQQHPISWVYTQFQGFGLTLARARYCQVLDLHRQGISQKQVATTLGIHPITVRTFFRARTFPERATYRRQSQLDPYVAFLHQRWAAGCKNPTQLWNEIVAQGYQGTPGMVRRYVAR